MNTTKSLSTQNDIEQLEIFSLKLLLDSLATIFVSEFKVQGVIYNVEIKSDLILTNYQTILVNVLRQLIENSLTHAFESVERPNVTIHAIQRGDFVEISYSDNGIGSVNIDKIFEPFYTTRRGSNCTGLGLPIIYNQVVHRLNGTVECNKSEPQGMVFNIIIPITLEASKTA